MRRYHQGKKPIYQYDAWKIIEDQFKPEFNHHSETIFALGNGYIGLRGTFEEGYQGDLKDTTPGTYINGVYDSERIHYGEFVYGMPEYSQTMLNLADWQRVRVQVGDEWIEITSGELIDYQRVLDLKNGLLIREMTWRSKKGLAVRIKVQRCISLVYLHRAVIRYEITPVNFSDEIKVISAINGDVENYHHTLQKKIQVLKTQLTENGGFLVQKTNVSDIRVVFAQENQFTSMDKDYDFEKAVVKDNTSIATQFTFTGRQGQTYCLDKFISFYTGRDLDTIYQKADYSETLAELLENLASNEVMEAKAAGFRSLINNQQKFLENYWEAVDIQIEGDLALQQGVRLNAFHLLQSTGRDGRTSIGAKGLTGEYYEGHYFWDTEIYIMPFFLYSRPELVRNLLLYRYSTLDGARERARVLRNKGALYPWRTINGQEASAFFEGSTAQYHINAAVVYGIYKYIEATADMEFMVNYGAEIIFETSRLWADRGGFVKMHGGQFCINEVCGPDEYKSGVNNNCYTNYMARFNLQLGVKIATMLQVDYPAEYHLLVEKIGLAEEEIAYWQLCAEKMYLPFNEELGIHPQDDSFLYKEDLDVNSLPDDQIPLVRNWHPLNIWRYQLCKQADVILLMFLLGNQFTLQVKEANYEYYEPRTTHDSSLSTSIFSIIASEIGKYTDAYNYFMQTARLDLDDYNGNTYEGIHTACMAGSWLGVTHGFAGMRVYNGKLYFNPYLPQSWKSYKFKVKFLGRILQLTITTEGVCYTLLQGDQLEFCHADTQVVLEESSSCVIRFAQKSCLS